VITYDANQFLICLLFMVPTVRESSRILRSLGKYQEFWENTKNFDVAPETTKTHHLNHRFKNIFYVFYNSIKNMFLKFFVMFFFIF